MPAKKGPHKGTGGHGRRKLTGKGPTPKAEERKGHPAQRRAKAAAKRATATPRPQRAAGRRPGITPEELVAGRNAVLEALRAGVPGLALRLAHGLEPDDRVTEIRALAERAELPVHEVSRAEIDRLAGGAPHQGVLLQAEPFSYH